MNKVIGVLVGLVVLASIGIFLLVSNIDGIVKNVIESVGTEVTGTDVSVGSVSIDLKTGKGTIKGLSIENPDGYASGDAFRLEEITLALDINSLSGEPVIINQIIVDGATVNYLAKGKDSNLQTIMNNVNSGGGSSGGDAASDEEGASTKIIIDEFRFTNASMNLSVVGVPGTEKNMVLDDVVSKNVGRSQNGVEPAEAAAIIMEPVIRKAVNTALNESGVMDKVKGLFR